MKHMAARLAALALLIAMGQPLGIASASPGEGKSAENATPLADEEKRRDEALKAIEQGFSIPAADGAATKDGAQKQAAPKK